MHNISPINFAKNLILEFFVYFSIILLIVLAIGDLVVGVANDAVNFLNSAIGSKVAPIKTILIVASVGLLLGSISSAGMMEIARKGVFYPEYFNLFDVLVIFLAVMLTDIILLDIFNTLGLPTSTTVSIIFELLGAAFIVSIFKIIDNNEPLNFLFDNSIGQNVKYYLNWSKTKTIISSIFLSVLLAFITGYVIMYISRILLGNGILKNNKTLYYLWSTIALVSISYFLVFKSLKSTYSTQTLNLIELQKLGFNIDDLNKENQEIKVEISKDYFVTFKSKKNITNSKKEIVYQAFFGNQKIKSISEYLKSNLRLILFIISIFWFLFVVLLDKLKINPLKFIVLFGTFSLALAFAGNDLVNFIGVSLAGLQSYQLFSLANAATNVSMHDFTMQGLNLPIQSSQIYLFIGGVIMIFALWFSKKSRHVTETEVNLGHQEETEEKFNSNRLSRGIVKFFIKNSKFFKKIIPKNITIYLHSRFKRNQLEIVEKEKPAFDLIRASVNLTISSFLIVIATDFKLPLSTTYVTFMVAMGSSLADKAWGRESASYRVAGVLNVILGWLITALVAFLLSILLSMIIFKAKIYGLVCILFFVIFLFYKTNVFHNKKIKRKNKLFKLRSEVKLDDDTISIITTNLSDSLSKISTTYEKAIDAIVYESESKINQAISDFEEVNIVYSDTKNYLFKLLKISNKEQVLSSKIYILSNDLMQDMLRSLNVILNTINKHIKNAHTPIKNKQADSIISIMNDVKKYIQKVRIDLEKNNFNTEKENFDIKKDIFEKIESTLNNQILGINKKEYGFKNSDLIVSLLMETKDIIAVIDRFPSLFLRIKEGKNPFLSI